MKISRLFVLLAAAQIVAATHCATAGELSSRIKFLTGLKTLYVLVDNSSQDAKRINLTTDAIQKAVEIKLRMAGIQVLSEDENLRTVGGPFMSVNIGMRARDAILFGDITIGVYEWGCLQRNSSSCGGLVTWQTSGLFTTKTKDAAQWLLDRLNDSMDIFLHDYFTANPRQVPIPSLPGKTR